jgi:DNA-binding transcriptional regulator YiaG
MEIALDLSATDFSNHCSDNKPSAFSGILHSLLGWSLCAGPGLHPYHHKEQAQFHPVAQQQPAAQAVPAPLAGQSITTIKKDWLLNMTELADILGVTRIILYSWASGKTHPSPSQLQHLQTLAAAAPTWQEMDCAKQDYLLDFTGPKANEQTLRQAMSQATVTADELSQLIRLRKEQYRKGREESERLFGPPLPLRAHSTPPRSAWELNRLWAANAKYMHAMQNRQP